MSRFRNLFLTALSLVVISSGALAYKDPAKLPVDPLELRGIIVGGGAAVTGAVDSNAALSALSTVYGRTVTRRGFAVAGDAPPVIYNASNAACSLNAGAGDGGYQVPSADGKCWVASVSASSLDVAIYGPSRDFVGNDGAKIQAALTAVEAMGGGEVVLGPFSYTASGTIIVPKSVRLRCAGVGQDVYQGVLDFTSKKCAIYSKVTGTTPAIDLRGGLRDIMILQWNVHASGNPSTRAANIALVSGYTGIGVQIGDGTVPGPANSTEMEKVTIGGFATCINTNMSSQDRKSHVFMDCTNGYSLLDSHDDDKNDHIEFWEFLTTNRPGVSQGWAISALADNGSGAWRVTTTTSHDLAANQSVGIRPATDGEGATGRWQVTPINSTQFDLQGSEVAPSRTGGTTSGSTLVTVNSKTNLRRGMAVSGTGIPAGTVIAGVWASQNAISISNAATATGSPTLTFASTPYTTGLSAFFNGNYRSGSAFTIKNSEGGVFTEAFSFASEAPFVLENAVGFSFVNSHIDGSHTANSATSVGVNFRGLSYNNFMQFSTFAGPMHGVLSAGSATPGFPNTVMSNRMFVQGVIAEVGQTGEDLIILGGGGQDNNSNFLQHASRTLTISGSQFPLARVYSTVDPAPWKGDATLAPTAYGPASRLQQLSISHPSGPVLNFFDASQGADGKRWRWSVGNGIMYLQTVDDANSVAMQAFYCNRSGNTPTQCASAVPFKLPSLTIAQTLATICNVGNPGAQVFVLDTVGSGTPTWGSAVAGGGSTAIKNVATCNGSSWVYQ